VTVITVHVIVITVHVTATIVPAIAIIVPAIVIIHVLVIVIIVVLVIVIIVVLVIVIIVPVIVIIHVLVIVIIHVHVIAIIVLATAITVLVIVIIVVHATATMTVHVTATIVHATVITVHVIVIMLVLVTVIIVKEAIMIFQIFKIDNDLYALIPLKDTSKYFPLAFSISVEKNHQLIDYAMQLYNNNRVLCLTHDQLHQIETLKPDECQFKDLSEFPQLSAIDQVSKVFNEYVLKFNFTILDILFYLNDKPIESKKVDLLSNIVEIYLDTLYEIVVLQNTRDLNEKIDTMKKRLEDAYQSFLSENK